MKDALLEFGSLGSLTATSAEFPIEIDFGKIDERRKFQRHNNADGEMNYLCVRFDKNVASNVTVTIQSKKTTTDSYVTQGTHLLQTPKGNVEHRIPMPAEFDRYVKVQISAVAADTAKPTAWIQRGAAVAV